MKTAKLGDWFEYEGQIVKVEWINQGHKAIGFKMKSKICCPNCKIEFEYDDHREIIEGSPQFQDNAKQIQTIKEN